ncbi:MAG: glycosyltransferase family 4 protein [Thermoplasmata archaeon]|nr:glycosyltransferase family 4 protein [Thermoplasmata archaeon]
MGIRLCVNTQTPPIRPLPGADRSRPVWRLREEYEPNLGGVVPMMRALIGSGRGAGLTGETTWVALGSAGLPPRVRTNEGFSLETFPVPEETRRRYARFKETIWRSFHGPRGFRPSLSDYPGFVDYSARTALALLPKVVDHDLLYVNDFQQVLVGGLIGSSAPALLRWHIPLDFRGYPEPVRRFFLKAMEGFDGIVVSTRAGLEDLIQAGFQGRAFQVYPYFDPREQRAASAAVRERVRTQFHLGDGPVVLCVGRMDPVKRQDLAIEAFARVARRFPGAKLVLVGGESFSTSSAGLGVGKASSWRSKLEVQIRALRLQNRVVLAGALPDEELRAMYGLTDAFVHPAPWEGFGLVIVEAWTHGIPVVVSRGAGAGELVDDGVNGFLTRPGSTTDIAQKLTTLLDRTPDAERIGANGAITARRCHVDRAAPRLKEIFRRTVELYERRPPRRRRAFGGRRP